ncbi:MAG TPA: sugar phosphate isomerase/epimerase family protein [bacterium]|nr:sugar phosphate isomerase/epimerase family protein [bacterium]HPP12110.1 sugar phosphate isomerase/epimerase family protein [bacterium]
MELRLGVQSYCFRHFKDNQKVASLVRECGLSRIELCGVHVNFSAPETFAAVVGTYQQAGVEIVSTGVNGLANRETEERKLFDFLRQAGAGLMSVSFDINTMPDCFRTAERLAEEYGINLAIHNHGGRHWLGSSEVLTYVFKNTSNRIGLCLDTAWALDSGENPVAMVEKFASRLYALHIKDFIFERDRRPRDVVAGKGNLNLKNLFQTLKKVGFSGESIIEYEGDVENPVPALGKCVASIQEAAATV